MKKLNNWMPAVFCAFISFPALLGWVHSNYTGTGLSPFFSFLPMCFVFMGLKTFQLEQEVGELRKQIEQSKK
jgi:hypothetical protein